LKSGYERQTGCLVVASTLCLVGLPATLLAVVLGLCLSPDPQVFKSTQKEKQCFNDIPQTKRIGVNDI
jgi:hypothetical protein